MSAKNTLEAKRLRKSNKLKDRGYPSFYKEVPTKYGSKFVQTKSKSEDIMTMDKALRMGFYHYWLGVLNANIQGV